MKILLLTTLTILISINAFAALPPLTKDKYGSIIWFPEANQDKTHKHYIKHGPDLVSINTELEITTTVSPDDPNYLVFNLIDLGLNEGSNYCFELYAYMTTEKNERIDSAKPEPLCLLVASIPKSPAAMILK